MEQASNAQMGQKRDWLEASYEYHLATRIIQRLEPAIMTTGGEAWRRWSLAINALAYPVADAGEGAWRYMGIAGKAGLRRTIASLLSAAWLIDCNRDAGNWKDRHRVIPVLNEAIDHLASHDIAAAQIGMEARPHKLFKALLQEPLPPAMCSLAALRQLRWLLRYSQLVTGPLEAYAAWENAYRQLIGQQQIFDPWHVRIVRTLLGPSEIQIQLRYEAWDEPLAGIYYQIAQPDDVGDFHAGPDRPHIDALRSAHFSSTEALVLSHECQEELYIIQQRGEALGEQLLAILQHHPTMQRQHAFSAAGLKYHLDRSIREIAGVARQAPTTL